VTGKNMKNFKYAPGQFAKWIFLAKGYYLQSHPFTISVEPGHDFIRLSAKGVGDFTKTLGQMPVGTKVLLDGPYGVFTPALSPNKKVLMIAGGSGITPLRAMVPVMLAEDRNVAMVYGNQTVAETMLANELTVLAQDPQFVWHNVLSADPTAPGEHGYITAELIIKLVPDARKRAVFLCGPPIMVQKLLPGLVALGISEDYIHYERFSL
jgi:predicted ferric reductase